MNAVEIAIRMETDAIAFYNEAAAKVKNMAGQRLFFAIVEDEKRHLELLTDLFKGLNVSLKDQGMLPDIKTVFEELKDEMMKKVEATADELNAFKIAMEMESEGVAFYKKAAAETASSDEKLLFGRLIEEEERHYTVFSNTYSFIKDTGNWFLWEERGLLDGG